ncbi:MurR/RpiR family transcriptional regulator [Bradyrhizobium sp. TZ2]
MATVRETIRREIANLTASERKIANAVLADYPFGALQTIQELAERTGVSAPSITRFVSKLGFAGYQEFQRQLIAELRESRRSPLELKASERLGSASAFLADYARRASERMDEMSASIPPEQFDRILALLADPARAVFVLGGRISDSMAGLLSSHLKQIDPRCIISPKLGTLAGPAALNSQARCSGAF